MSKDDTIKALAELNEKQAGQISALLVHAGNLELIIEKQAGQISTLTLRVDDLENELSVYKNRKNSNNSHTPPSVDLGKPKRNQSLREKSGKKAGGQPGHEGSTLAFWAAADEIIIHVPQYCHRCGDDLTQVPAIALSKRQVIDIPKPVAICTEHQIFSKACSCGHITKCEFPINVNANIQYGCHIEALTAYLNVRQYMPFGRIQEFYSKVMGLEISQGGIVGLLQRFTAKALPMYQEIKNRIEKSTCLGTDETGAKINGKTHWFWTWQNDALTFIVQSQSRGYKTIQKTFPEGLPDVVLVHDRWAPHFRCEAVHHQICLAHLFRDLNYIVQVHASDWAGSLKLLLKRAIALNNEAGYDPAGAGSDNMTRCELADSIANLLGHKLPDKDKLAIRLQKKLRKISHYILCFLYYNDVPPDNNGSERAIRNIKVKQKISGGFRSIDGADGFAVLRSVIDTTIKSGNDVFYALSLIANLGAE
ncbi:IS66 family transposase [Mucilaginibacter sp. UYCu711]|uniref:IS66 family transposase n=1 Tax=Mucilaginibacter sp. UYCu711 TaxID=3156339 RepID=UPI003D21E3EE